MRLSSWQINKEILIFNRIGNSEGLIGVCVQ